MPARPPASVTIRSATVADLPAINAIYNHYVLHSTCTYQTEPETARSRQAWFERHDPLHPVIVAVGGDGIVGWGALSAFHARAAYSHTVENSVYVRDDCRRRGIGRLLLSGLADRARAAGHHTILASIDASQTASLALHRSFGFVETAHLLEVGHKFGRWLDVIYLQLLLSRAPAGAPPPP